MTRRCDVCGRPIGVLFWSMPWGGACSVCRHWESQVLAPWPGLVPEHADCWRWLR